MISSIIKYATVSSIRQNGAALRSPPLSDYSWRVPREGKALKAQRWLLDAAGGPPNVLAPILKAQDKEFCMAIHFSGQYVGSRILSLHERPSMQEWKVEELKVP
ncbi:unnamed protein product, partial [Iphiclides podalirius]